MAGPGAPMSVVRSNNLVAAVEISRGAQRNIHHIQIGDLPIAALAINKRDRASHNSSSS